jgi:hypothetical protein
MRVKTKIFLEKYTQEIMPEIRKTGKYIMNENDKSKLDKLNNKLENYKQEVTYYHDKYNFVPSEHGYLYINQNDSINYGKNIKCFKIGYAENMKKRLTEYKVGNFGHKLLCYIPLDINRSDVEKCIKLKMKPHLLKLITDTVCYTSIKELQEEIIDCIDIIKSHICHCMFCKKKYNFNKLTSHDCNVKNEFINVSKKISSIGLKKGSKKAKSSKGSKKAKSSKGSKKAKSSNGSKKIKSSKGSKKAKSSKGSKKIKSSKGYKLTKSSKGSKKVKSSTQ